MDSTSGGLLRRFFAYQSQSCLIQAALLIALPVYVVAFSYWCNDKVALMFGYIAIGDLRIPFLMVVTLILLEAYAITVITWRRVVDSRVFTFTTLMIACFGILSTTDLSPRDPIRFMFFTTWLIAPPFLAMCIRQESKMRSVIACLVVFPTLLRSHASRQDIDVLTKAALVSPALAFVTYKTVTRNDCAKLLCRQKDVQTKLLKYLSGMVIFAGVLFNTAGLVYHLPLIVLLGGFALAIAGGIAFSIVFVNEKEETNKMKAITRLIVSIFGITMSLLFITIALSGTYSWQKWSRQFVFVLVAGITIHFYWLAYLHRFIRNQVPNWLNFLALLCVTFAMSFAAVSLRFSRDITDTMPYLAARVDYSYYRHMQYYNESLGFPAIDGFPFDDESAGSMRITALECCLIVIYLMMATIHKADEQLPAAETETAGEAAAMLPGVAAAAAGAAALDAAAEPCCASEPYSEDEEYEAPRHKTLEEPD